MCRLYMPKGDSCLEINIQDFLSKLTVGTKIDKDLEFLKNYDINGNSIFDVEDIEAIKQDIEIANKEDGDESKLTQKDLLTFYNNAMKKLNPNFKETKSFDAMGELKDWIELVSAGKASEYANLKTNIS